MLKILRSSGSIAKRVVLLSGLCALSGCSIAGFGPDVDETISSNSIPQSEPVAVGETVDPSDWDKIRSVMETAFSSQDSGQGFPWENEVTGTIGTIVPMVFNTKEDGRLCRTFSTTLNGVGGVLQYKGDACQTNQGAIELVDLEPHSSVVDISTVDSELKIQ